MGDHIFSETSYTETKRKLKISDEHVTKVAEQKAQKTGRLASSVDPANCPLRRSLLRLDPLPNGQFVVTVGMPIPFEERTDTTGSMGNNVDITMKNLPTTFGLVVLLLPPGTDLQAALGIFGDVGDKFVLQRPQFEMSAEKIVTYLADMVPERDGKDPAEDPQYGLFAAAYLTDAYAYRIGLKGYDFTVSDADAHDDFSVETLERIFGDKVFDSLAENQQNYPNRHIPTKSEIRSLTIKEVVQDLLQISHAFFLQVKQRESIYNFWSEIYGRERVIIIPDTKCAPQVKAAIVGLTEGILTLGQTKAWLQEHGISEGLADDLTDQLSRIPLRAQAILKAQLPHPLPKKGDIFAQKTDLWPVEANSELFTETERGMEWDL